MNRRAVLVLCLVAAAAGFFGAQSLVAVDEKQTAADRMRQDFELMKLFAETYEQIDSHYVTEVDRRELVEAAIRGMVAHLDQYSTYIQPEDLKRFEQHIEQAFVGIGISVNTAGGKLEIVSPLAGSPAFRAGLRTGDVITEIDGQSVAGLSPAEVARLLAGPPGRSIVLGVLKPQATEAQQVTVIRDTIQVPTVVGHNRDAEQQWDFMLNAEKKIGYVRLTHFSRNTATELRTAVDRLVSSDLKGLVLDLRSNPGGLMESSIEIADMFLDTGKIVSMKGRSVPERSWQAKRGDTLPSFPLAVIVNRLSASASEVLSASLQDNERAVIVGERTWGKGSVQNLVELESGRSALKLTTASYFRPSGINIHRFAESKPEDAWGVMPSAGHAIELSKEQWADWTKSRETADTLRPQDPAVSPSVFIDLQLDDAVNCLLAELDKVPAESVRPESTDQPEAPGGNEPGAQN